tara:strand:+ start:109 stop:456 length:348 start_codon:yes stop_codon:yes gene_type:complete
MSIATLIDKYGVSVSHGTRSLGTDAVGGQIETWSYALGETALVQMEGGSDGVIGGRENRSRSATFFFAAGKSISIEDRIRYNGQDFEVRSIKTPHERPTTDALSYVIVKADQVLS